MDNSYKVGFYGNGTPQYLLYFYEPEKYGGSRPGMASPCTVPNRTPPHWDIDPPEPFEWSVAARTDAEGFDAILMDWKGPYHGHEVSPDPIEDAPDDPWIREMLRTCPPFQASRGVFATARRVRLDGLQRYN